VKSAICTLFEGHYHYGVAALTNSLYHHGFRGEVFVGYRGTLTSWASAAKDNPSIKWPGTRTLDVADGLQLHFLPLNTNFHFTTYKPYFMLSLLEGIAKDVDGLMYFDPDIVIKCRWSFFERWITYGVGLVQEIVNHDMPPTHPTRFMWNEIIEQSGRKVVRNLYSYINAGFCGVSSKHIEFIETWRDIIDVAIEKHNFDPATFIIYDRASIFCGDQDGLNIAAMCCRSPISEVGPQEMDFLHGGFLMSHANSALLKKPWKKSYILLALNGINPSLQDKAFWLHTSKPISLYSPFKMRTKKISLALASLLGRFYKRT
jgi:hypothetical protein